MATVQSPFTFVYSYQDFINAKSRGKLAHLKGKSDNTANEVADTTVESLVSKITIMIQKYKN